MGIVKVHQKLKKMFKEPLKLHVGKKVKNSDEFLLIEKLLNEKKIPFKIIKHKSNEDGIEEKIILFDEVDGRMTGYPIIKEWADNKVISTNNKEGKK